MNIGDLRKIFGATQRERTEATCSVGKEHRGRGGRGKKGEGIEVGHGDKKTESNTVYQ